MEPFREVRASLALSKINSDISTQDYDYKIRKPYY